MNTASDKMQGVAPLLPNDLVTLMEKTDLKENELNLSKSDVLRLNESKERIGASNDSLLTISSTFNSLFKVLCIFPSRYLCSIGFPPLFSFRWNLPPNFGLHSQTTRLMNERTMSRFYKRKQPFEPWTGLSPSMMPLSKGLWLIADFWVNRFIPRLQFGNKITIDRWNSLLWHNKLQHLIVSDFKLELLPFHSPLLRESSLVSFPPLIDMLKFSGW